MAATSTRRVLAALRKVLVPHLNSLGFEGDYPELVRATGRELQFVHFQNDKLSQSFSINLGWIGFRTVRAKQLEQMSGTPVIRPKFAETPDNNRARLHCMEGAPGAEYSVGGFGYGDRANDPEACRALAQSIVDAWPAVELWFTERKVSGGVGVRFNHPPNGPR